VVQCVRTTGLFCALFGYILRQHFVAVCVRRVGGVCGERGAVLCT